MGALALLLYVMRDCFLVIFMTFLLCYFGVCALIPRAAASQERVAPVRKLIVGTGHVPPFSIKNPDGTRQNGHNRGNNQRSLAS